MIVCVLVYLCVVYLAIISLSFLYFSIVFYNTTYENNRLIKGKFSIEKAFTTTQRDKLTFFVGPLSNEVVEEQS